MKSNNTVKYRYIGVLRNKMNCPQLCGNVREIKCNSLIVRILRLFHLVMLLR